MSTQKTVRQEAGTVDENALGLDEEKAEQIIEALKTDLADAYVLYHQLHKHRWNVEGAEFLEIHVFLREVYSTLALSRRFVPGVPVRSRVRVRRHPRSRSPALRVRRTRTAVPTRR